MFGWAPAVYFLCFLASAGCGFFLVRSYLHNRTQLLLWSAVCFVLLALNNFLLVLDLVFFPVEIDLSVVRPLVSLAAVSAILYGFIGAGLMETTTMATISFLSGAITMGFMIAGLFFFRFWRKTADVFFCYFGISFWLLACSQALSIMLGRPNDDQFLIYLLRLTAFVVLIVGIVSKNLGRSKPADRLQVQ